MSKTSIEWTEDTWNPLAGCKEVGPECTNCYAAVMARRLEAMGQAKYAGTTHQTASGKTAWTGKISLDESALTIPLKRKKPTMYFVNSMSDLFHEDVPDEFVNKVFAVMALAKQHTFQVLTKRAERMAAYCSASKTGEEIDAAACMIREDMVFEDERWLHQLPCVQEMAEFPFPNVWLGVSCGNRKHGLPRIEHLRQTPAAVRMLSIEPLLEDLGQLDLEGIHWVIAGCESGHGRRPMLQEWVENIAEQCKESGVRFFMKQMEVNGRVCKDLILFPKNLQLREYPECHTIK